MKSDVVIVGAGIAGLTTGALLAHAGLRVTILERGNRIGGRANAHEDKGFVLNYGAHAMYRPDSGLLAEVMRRLGRTSPPCSYTDPAKAYWADGERWGSLSARPHQALASGLFPLASKARLGPLMLALRTANPQKIPAGQRWGEWLDARTPDLPLRRFMRAFATINSYSARPDDLTARGVVRHIKENIFVRDHAGYMHGGWKVLFDALVEAIEERGGTIVTGARVRWLEERHGRIEAAVTEDGRYEAGSFVLTLPPQDAPALVHEPSPLGRELARWASMQDVRAVALDLGFSRRVRTDLTLAFDIERELYYSLHSEVAPGLAPHGAQLLHCLAYLTPEDAASDTAVERRYQELLAGLDRFFPGWRDSVVIERTMKNVRVTGARRTPEQYAPGGVPLRPESAANLYFANDARDVPHFLSLASLASALEVASVLPGELAARPASAVAVA